jgi:uncharacterized membrane protein YfcA
MPVKASHAVMISAGRIAASAPLGFLIGLSLGTLGGGGSILAVPALVYGAGEAAHAATTTSLIVVGSTALVGMVGHFRAGRVHLWAGLAFGLVGIGGSFLGSLLNRDVPGDVLLLAFSGLILVAAWRMRQHHTETPCHARQQAAALRATGSDGSSSGSSVSSSTAHPDNHGASTSPATSSASDPVQSAQTASSSASSRHARATMDTVLRVVLAGTAVGFLTGFFGVGGGFVIVPALVLALGYDMPVAVGTSLLVIAVSSAEGLVFRLSSGGIDWRVALPFTAAGLIGVLLGGPDRRAGAGRQADAMVPLAPRRGCRLYRH